MTFHRFVALGDSFTEGVGDPDPTRPNGLRGWADRVAEVLAGQTDDFGYANLAIRGRKLPAIIDEQVEPALALEPDLVTIHGGGNDILRPRIDIDALVAAYDDAIARLVASGAHVAMFTVFDPGPTGVFAAMRGRFALFNEGVREIADRHDVTLVDMWRMRDADLSLIMDTDRHAPQLLRPPTTWRGACSTPSVSTTTSGPSPPDAPPAPRASRPGGRARRAGPASSWRPGSTAGSPVARRATRSRRSARRSPPSSDPPRRRRVRWRRVRFRRILRM